MALIVQKTLEAVPVVDVSLGGMRPVVEVDGTGTAKLLSTGMSDNPGIAVLLGSCFEYPIVVRVFPHDGCKAWGKNIWILGAV